MIRMKHVKFRYEDLVMDFSLHVEKGSFTAIVGPSGAGKSTLLSLLAGFEQPLSGSILIDGRDMTGVAPAARPVTMIFQDNNDFAHLDLWSNVALGVKPSLKLDANERIFVDQALAQVGLALFKNRRPGDVSGGERQRVAIARALVRDRPVLLLDEPFAGLGPSLRRDMLDLIKELQLTRHLTVLMVSHQPEDAAYAAERTAFVSNGRVIAHGPTEEVLGKTQDTIIRDYLGDWRS